jgi:nucleoside-diphosphate-sugar epimerase
MKVLITGAAGYLGSVLTPMLLKEGYDVVALDNFMYGQSSLLDCCIYKQFQVVRGDARDEVLMKQLMKDADYIIPLACIVGMPACNADPIRADSTNLGAIRMMLDISKEQRIIFANTNSGYGKGEKNKYCTEETPLKPVSLYGKLKVEAEREILDAGNSLTLRLATVFGCSPRMRMDLLVNDFVYRAVKDRYIVLSEPNFKRNYIHIRDVARAFIFCIEHFEDMKGQAYNVGLSDANLSKRELCEEIKKQIPDLYIHEAEFMEDVDKRDYIVSNEKIEKVGYKPIFSLSYGIQELIKGYQIIRPNQYTNL